jgi:hypothetical protein
VQERARDLICDAAAVQNNVLGSGAVVCQDWVLHIQKSSNSHEQNYCVYAFMQKYLLNCLEMLSLLSKLDNALIMLGS